MSRLLLGVFLCCAASLSAPEEFDPLDPTDDDAQTGIAVGAGGAPAQEQGDVPSAEDLFGETDE